uniref:Uncharacterized protein n=1 Tax=Arundo donax TaxID=35708 RepID=A0A0A9BLY4_ARUDO
MLGAVRWQRHRPATGDAAPAGELDVFGVTARGGVGGASIGAACTGN